MTAQYRWKTNRPLGLSEGWPWPLNRGDRPIEVKIKVINGKQIRDFDNWPPNTGWPLNTVPLYTGSTVICPAQLSCRLYFDLKYPCFDCTFYEKHPNLTLLTLTVRILEQIMSADKYLFIFSCQIEVTVYSGAFGGLILQVEFGYLFLIMIVNLIWRQMFLRKLRFATRYQYISMMLLQDDWLLRKWLYFIKIDPVQEFPGNNPPLYFYPFNNLVFRLNPCWAPDQEKIF